MRDRRHSRLHAGFVLLLVIAAACSFGRRGGDLNEIREEGILRVIVRPGFGEWPTPLGLGGGDERVLVEGLAARLGLTLEWVTAPGNDELLHWLLEGRGDLALGRFSPADLEGHDGVVAGATVDWVAEEIVSTQDGPIATVEDLDDAVIALQPSARERLGRDQIDGGWWGSAIEAVPEEDSVEEILRQVSFGRYGATVADSGLVAAVRSLGFQLRTVSLATERRPLVWAFRERSPLLRRAVDGFLFAEKVLSRAEDMRECRDLQEIRRLRTLRLVTRNSPVTVTVERGGLQGFEYDLVTEFSRELGVRVELAIPPPGVEPATWLEAGHGDLMALHEPLPIDGWPGLFASIPYRHVDLVAVVASRTVALGGVEDLSGLDVAASTAVGTWVEEIPVSPPMRLASLGAAPDALASLVAVSRGEAYAAVVDADTAHLELDARPDLEGETVVLPQVPIAWAVGPESPQLQARVDRFLYRSRRNGVIRQLERNHLGNWKPFVPRRMPTIPPGALTPYDELLRWAGRTNGIDWRLLASLMYEESRFDPDAVGPGGSAGLFQFMPFTWVEMGVDDPHNPGEAAQAGARYLRRLMDLFEGQELHDQVAMAIAGYNVGPGHVFDARRLAREMGLSPDIWLGNVETTMLLIDNPEVARKYPSGVCRCRRAVGYTRRILRRYAAYREMFPPA